METADAARKVAIARPDDPALTHLAVVGDTYTVLLSGDQTDGRFAMLDMLIPPGGGPPPHCHDIEECFRVLEGSIEVRVGNAPPVLEIDGLALQRGDRSLVGVLMYGRSDFIAAMDLLADGLLAAVWVVWGSHSLRSR